MLSRELYKGDSFECTFVPSMHKDIVTMTGALALPVSEYVGDESVVFDLYAALLIKGTTHLTKMQIAEKCESIGASLSFQAHKRYLVWRMSCLRDDVHNMLELLTTILAEPTFPESEWQLLQRQILTQLREDSNDPEAQADIHLNQAFFSKDHPNFIHSTREQIAAMEAFSVDVCHRLHAFMRQQPIVCVAVGDLPVAELKSTMSRLWHGRHGTPPPCPQVPLCATTSRSYVMEMVDKPSIVCLWGKALPFDITHPDYWPLRLGIDILGGGGFNSRLMSTVREQSGLTYRIYSTIKDMELGLQGYMVTYASFGQEQVEQGVRETREQIDLWVQQGIHEEELALKKQTLLNRQAMTWSKTSAIAGTILYGLMNGYGHDYIDHFSRLVSDVTLSQVNEALKRWCQPDGIQLVVAGSVPESMKSLSE